MSALGWYLLTRGAYLVASKTKREQRYLVELVRMVREGIPVLDACRRLVLAYGGERAVDEAARKILR